MCVYIYIYIYIYIYKVSIVTLVPSVHVGIISEVYLALPVDR